MEISRLVSERRGLAGDTQSQAAEAIGVSAPTISRWESGEDVPRRKSVPALAKYLGVSQAKVLAAIHSQLSPASSEGRLEAEVSELRRAVEDLARRLDAQRS